MISEAAADLSYVRIEGLEMDRLRSNLKELPEDFEDLCKANFLSQCPGVFSHKAFVLRDWRFERVRVVWLEIEKVETHDEV